MKSLLSPITQNPDFPAGVSSHTFLSWREVGIHVFGDFVRDNTLLSFQQLQEAFNIPKHHFFGYLQIRHFVSSQTSSFFTNNSYSEVESFLLKRKHRKHFIAALYSLLGSSVTHHLPDISHRWEKDLNNEYIEDDWQASICLIRSTSTCNRLRETQYKILHRLHITPVILNKIDHSISPLCTKCNLERGTYYHYFWECKLISRFWTLISKEVSGIFKIKIKKDPGVFLLGLPSRALHLTALHYKLLEKLLLVARKCILQNWIKTLPPSVTLWYREIFNILPHERIQAGVKGRDELFLKVWTPFLDYIPADLKNLLLMGRQFSEWKKASPCNSQIVRH